MHNIYITWYVDGRSIDEHSSSSIKSVFQKLANALHESGFFLSLLLFLLSYWTLHLLPINHLLRVDHVIVVVVAMVATRSVMMLHLKPVRLEIAVWSFRMRIHSVQNDVVGFTEVLDPRVLVRRNWVLTSATRFLHPRRYFSVEMSINRMKSGEIRAWS